MTAYVLAAGKGSKVWPYAEVRPKPMIPVGNRPVIVHLVNALLEAGYPKIVVGAGSGIGEISSAFRGEDRVSVQDVGNTRGPAETLDSLWDDGEPAAVFYGDTIIDTRDLQRFVDPSPSDGSVLLTSFPQGESGDWISASVKEGTLSGIIGHPRGGAGYRFAGFTFPWHFRRYVAKCPEFMRGVQVGMMVPEEPFIESALEVYLRDGATVSVTETEHPSFDIDKPWHILTANKHLVDSLTATGNQLSEGAKIDPSAQIDGTVVLGAGSTIGKNVVIRGNVVVGDRTTIDNGAIIDGNAIVGSDARVVNYCYVGGGSTVGDECVVNHCAELSGMIMRKVYLYHYMEISGVVGEATDIGAATVCGSLRFDDGNTIHRIKGRREFPGSFANASYIGDYCRTGVNAVIMPGCKTGPYSIVGPGVVLDKDLPARTALRLKQELEESSWGPERYGW